MKLFKKLFAIGICLALILSTVSITVLAADNVPEISQSEDLFVISNGLKIQGVLGNASKSGQAHLPGYDRNHPAEISFTNPGLAKYSYFEFDYYVENITNFNARGIKLYFNVRTNSSSKGIFEFQTQITKSGWNHVKIAMDLDSYVLNSFNKVRFYIDMNAGETGASDSYKIANITATTPIDTSEESYTFNQSVTVGKDQTEIIVTWIDTIDRNGKVVLTKNGVETEFTAVKRYSAERGLYSYAATITDLTANTSYTYRIEAGDLVSKEFPFETQDFDDSFSFIHISDVQYGGSSSTLNNWKNTLSLIDINFPETSFIVNSGDVSDISSNNDYYQSVKSPDIFKKYAMGVAPGNHDNTETEGGDGYYCLNFTSPNTYEPYDGYALNGYDYWYSYNNVLFISLNSLISDVQYHKDFVTKVIKEQGDKFDWTIVNCHFSLFSASYHSTESATVKQREGLAPLFRELGVDLVLSGHDHCYDRSYVMDGVEPQVSGNSFSTSSDGVLYISATTASGLKYNTAVESSNSYSAKVVEEKYGFINYEVTEDEITLTFYNSADMSVLDKFTLYNDNGDHTVEPESDLLKDRNLENIKLNSNGKYTATFNTADISEACKIELDLGLTTDSALNSISLSLLDANGNSYNKDSGLVCGWNHLVINTDDISGIDLTKITALELSGTAGAELDIANLYVGHTYTDKKDNTCETCDYERPIDYFNIIPELTQSEGIFVIQKGVKIQGVLGNASKSGQDHLPGYSSGTPAEVIFTNPGLANYSYFEFDFYIENIANFKARKIKMYFNIRIASGSKKTYEFTDQITQSGWNHIKLAMNSDASTLNVINRTRFYIDMNAGETGANDRYRIANICATKDIPIPTDVMKNKVNFIGAEFKQINFGASGYSANLTTDISNTRMIELDIYINDDSNTTLNVKLGDGSGVYAYYEFNGLTKGWNHLAVRIDDMENIDKLNLANITNFTLSGAKYTTVHVSNFYAADYINGDANRDGVLDLKDIIRAKKLFVGLTNEGNKLAVTGNDYLIDAIDITALSNAIIAELFK